MYNDYFGFKEAPFSIAPDPQFLYMSDRHREALAHLLYGFQSDGGFVLLTGEVGTGKTTVCRCLLEQVPENSDIAFVLNPKLTVTELLETICDELRIETPQGVCSIKVFIDAINRFLLATHSKGRKTVLIIDEAQNLSVSVLEQIRLLTNLETNKQKLLQVIMLGQPELKQILEQPELRQLAQRITARYHLEPLAKSEIKAYVCHRLAVAGVERPLFSVATLDKLYQLTGGVPRLLNLLCDRALLAAYVREVQTVSPALLVEASREVFGRQLNPQRSAFPAWKWLLSLSAAGFGIALLAFFFWPGSIPPPSQAVRLPVSQNQTVTPSRWDEQLDITNSGELAYQKLFEVWGRNYQADQGAARDQAARYGLGIAKKSGSLGRLRQLNSPAVLQLQNSQGEEFYATLTRLSDGMATLVVGSQQRVIPLADLAGCWLGEFSLLWQLPPHYTGSVRPGDSGNVVKWLDRQMAVLNDRNPREEDFIFDGQLLEEVKQFQVDAGLEPDGVVGIYTLILLNIRLNPLQPTLVTGLKG
ncbi:ExeA family protein [Malonomonas rubra]|uniref:ExeA family protein n=1 Tax=Malonomonas rubra TaxID=57040 RepID=UPI0026F0167D|nr:AAA family ATPase [Malonomonas rubra]